MVDGIECPACGSRYNECTNVYRLTAWLGGRQVTKLRRRRVCRHCGKSFYSHEEMEERVATAEKPRTAGDGQDAPRSSVVQQGQGQQAPRIVNPFL